MADEEHMPVINMIAISIKNFFIAAPLRVLPSAHKAIATKSKFYTYASANIYKPAILFLFLISEKNLNDICLNTTIQTSNLQGIQRTVNHASMQQTDKICQSLDNNHRAESQ